MPRPVWKKKWCCNLYWVENWTIPMLGPIKILFHRRCHKFNASSPVTITCQTDFHPSGIENLEIRCKTRRAVINALTLNYVTSIILGFWPEKMFFSDLYEGTCFWLFFNDKNAGGTIMLSLQCERFVIILVSKDGVNVINIFNRSNVWCAGVGSLIARWCPAWKMYDKMVQVIIKFML